MLQCLCLLQESLIFVLLFNKPDYLLLGHRDNSKSDNQGIYVCCIKLNYPCRPALPFKWFGHQPYHC